MRASIPHNRTVLPLDLPFDLPFTLPVNLPTDSPVAWVAIGAGAAVVGLIAFRRARKLALLATTAIIVGIVVWNNGMLPAAS